MSLAYSDAVIADRLQALTRALDSGGGPGSLKLYTAPRPARGAAVTTQTLLVTVHFNRPSSANVVGNVLTFDVISPALILASGVPVWGRFLKSDNTFVADLDIGTDTTTADMVFPPDPVSGTVILYAGGNVSLVDASYSDV